MDHPLFEVGDKSDPQSFTPEPPARRPRGCFFYGCMTALVVGVLGLVVTVASTYIAYNFLNNLVNEYTATEQVPVPTLTLPDDQREALDDRWKAFKTAVDKGEAAEIVLTADDINALIAEKPELKGKVYISIEGDQVSGQVSIPLDEIGLPLTKGRFLNGTTALTVSIDHGYLDVRMKSIEVNGKSPPPDVMAKLGQQNLAKDVKFDDETGAKMRQIESLEIKDGGITLKARARSKDDEDKAKTKEPMPAKDEDVAKGSETPEAKGGAPKEPVKPGTNPDAPAKAEGPGAPDEPKPKEPTEVEPGAASPKGAA
jgi:hypothetical protein